jgi:hypothetical protein
MTRKFWENTGEFFTSYLLYTCYKRFAPNLGGESPWQILWQQLNPMMVILLVMAYSG